MKFVKISSIAVGALMLLQWLFFLATGNVPELATAPISISFHISIEIITALILIVSGISATVRSQKSLFGSCFAQGMLCYTVVNSSGYFAQQKQYLFLVMFFVLLVTACANFWLLIHTKEGT